jgi:hypothetical protein
MLRELRTARPPLTRLLPGSILISEADMRKLFPLISLLCVLTTALFAQMRGGFRGGLGGGFRGGFHGGLGGGFHGGFRTPAIRSGFGHRGFGGFRSGFFSPFSYPIFFSDFWGPGWDYSYNPYLSYPFSSYPYPPQPNVIVIYPPPQPAPPPVVIEENSPPNTVRYETRQRNSQPDPGSEQPVFSLAFKDHSVSRAVAYWVVGKTLNYVTTQGKRYAIPLAQVDRPTSMKLNRERGVAFGLPAG